MLRLLSFCLLIPLLSSCGSRLKYNLSSKQLSSAEENIVKASKDGFLYFKSSFHINLSEQEQQEVFFKDLKKQATVLFFASEFCLSCQEEAEKLVHKLKDRDIEKLRINLVTIMIEDDPYVALDFKEIWQIPWMLGYDQNSLFKEFCPNLRTPCVLVLDPVKGLALNTEGSVEIEKIEEITGEWFK